MFFFFNIYSRTRKNRYYFMLTECFFYQSPVLFFFPLEFSLKRDVRTFIGKKKTDRKELGNGSGVSKGELGRTKVQGRGEEAKAGMKE